MVKLDRTTEQSKGIDWAIFVWLMVFVLIRITINLLKPNSETSYSPGLGSTLFLAASYMILLNKWKVRSDLAGRDPSRLNGAWFEFAVRLFIFSCTPLILQLIPAFLIMGYYQLIPQIILWSFSLNLIQLLGLAFREQILSRSQL